MGLIAVPNVSEGRDASRIAALAEAVEGSGARVIDTHSDAAHHRTVFTVHGTPGDLVDGLTRLACAARAIDLETHGGVHPRLGVLDVCPIVPHVLDMQEAIACARRTGEAIGARCDLPVYLYGRAATRSESSELPDLRRGGLASLIERSTRDLPPDHGPMRIDPRHGVVCVGARGPLIAFNIWIDGDADRARAIARSVRGPGVRALGLALDERTAQVSLNLTDPGSVGIDAAFERVRTSTEADGVRIRGTEIVGVPPERFMPDPTKEAARLLLKPGRSLENALTA